MPVDVFSPSATFQTERTFKITALDGLGAIAQGATVDFSADGMPCGGATVSLGAISLHVPASVNVVEVRASFGGEELKALLHGGTPNHTFRFFESLGPSTRRSPNRQPGVAQCPDGSTGQPCVICNINGLQIRICA